MTQELAHIKVAGATVSLPAPVSDGYATSSLSLEKLNCMFLTLRLPFRQSNLFPAVSVQVLLFAHPAFA